MKLFSVIILGGLVQDAAQHHLFVFSLYIVYLVGSCGKVATAQLNARPLQMQEHKLREPCLTFYIPSSPFQFVVG